MKNFLAYYTLLCMGVLVIETDAVPFTIIAIPDTQFYCQSYPEIFTSQTQWVADNRTANNIVFAAHLGDIVQTGSDLTMWSRADASMAVLDANAMPYGVVIGNHDLDDLGGDRGTRFRAYFGPDRFSDHSGYGGHSADGLNSWHTFTAGGWQFLSIHLDLDAPDAALAWAQGIIDNHLNIPTIISTHNYLDEFSGRTIGPYIRTNGNGGEEIWQKLIKSNDQIFFTLNGHRHTERLEVAYNDFGHEVYQIIADYQDRPNGGDGWLQMYTFVPEDNEIHVQTYSPWLDQYEMDADSEYTISINFNERFDLKQPVAHWTFDDGMSNPGSFIAVDSAGNNDAVLEDYPSPAWIVGKINGALAFDGVSNSANAGAGSLLDITGALTLSAWFNKQSSGSSSYSHLLGKKQKVGSLGDSYYIKSMNDDTLVFGITPDDNFEIQGVAAVPQGQWHHVAAVYVPGTSMTIYLDGELYHEEMIAIPTLTKSVTTPFTMGQIDTLTPEFAFNGFLDDVRVYASALNQEDVQKLFVQKSGLVAHWPLDDGLISPTSSTAEDVIGTNTGALIDFTAPPTWITSDLGGALAFDGTNDSVYMGSGPDLDITGELTMALWINKQGNNSNNNYAHLAGKNQSGGPADDSYYLKSQATDQLTFGVTQNGVNIELTGTASVSRDQWHSVVAVFVPNVSMRIYLDGQLYAAKTTGVPGYTAITNAPFMIGQISNRDTGYSFNGYLDDVRLYNLALSQEEIETLYGLKDQPYCVIHKSGDLNQDCYVDFIDIVRFIQAENFDIDDLINIAQTWLKCTDLKNPSCQ
ncbi:MAG: hypothetical protein JW709_06310 [Sedimentisphaerales bacterium]|nr:hypothetical protein [Sedimentisphaerales bacterium]